MENKILLTDPQVYVIMLIIIIYIAVMYGRTIIVRFSNKATIIKLETVKVEGLVGVKRHIWNKTDWEVKDRSEIAGGVFVYL